MSGFSRLFDINFILSIDITRKTDSVFINNLDGLPKVTLLVGYKISSWFATLKASS